MLKLASCLALLVIGTQATTPNIGKYAVSYKDLRTIVNQGLTVFIESPTKRHLAGLPFDTNGNTRFRSNCDAPDGDCALKIVKIKGKSQHAIKSIKHSTYLRANYWSWWIWWNKEIASYEEFDVIHLGGEYWAFRSKNPAVNYMRENRGSSSPKYQVDFVHKQGSWEKFKIKPKPMMKSFEWHVDRSTLENPQPLFTGKIVVENKCPTKDCPNQSKTFRISKGYTNTYKFEVNAGYSVTAGTEFETGIPIVSNGKVTASITASMDFTMGTSNAKTETFTVVDPCIASADMVTTCSAWINRAKVTVPYTITWTNGEKTEGMFQGMQHYDGGTKTESKYIE